MPGFGILCSNKWDKGFGLPEHSFLNEQIRYGNYTVFRSTLRKFENDKVFENSKDFLIVLEGVLLNKKQLLENSGTASVSELIKKRYFENEEFFSQFRGPFCGALFDKKKRRWLIFTNQTGEKAVYYRYDDDGFAAATNLNLIFDISRENGRTLTVDENAAYMALTFGHMEDASTYAKEVKRLRGGTYLCIDGSGCKVKEYHSFKKDPERFRYASEDKIIESIEEYFSAAVRSQFEKDLEYGYKHLCDLSGGLDSRMDMWVAHDLGYKDLTLLNYGKADYLDEQISKKIALYWKDDQIIMPIDNLNFLSDIDKMVEMNGGTAAYCAFTGGARLLERINMQPFGLAHSGLIGEVVLGSHFGLNSEEDIKDRASSPLVSNKLADRLKENSKYIDSFYDYEVYLRYVAEFQGDANSVQVRNYYTEVFSPFLDVEFLQLCFDIPVAMRADHGIYKKWILAKHPKAADFKWERINGYIYDSPKKLLYRKMLYKGPHKAAKILGLEKASPLSMNPFDYWLLKDREARQMLIGYFKETYPKVAPLLSQTLKDDLKELFRSGTAVERFFVITVIAELKRMIG